jgi:hypothetical protein
MRQKRAHRRADHWRYRKKFSDHRPDSAVGDQIRRACQRRGAIRIASDDSVSARGGHSLRFTAVLLNALAVKGLLVRIVVLRC